MASIIRIKRSAVSGNPNTLAAGELAYSGLTNNDSNGGDRLYIGLGTESGGNAANHIVIGGKYFTDLMDHARGTLTADSAIITDADNKINLLKVDNIQLDGNTISINTASGNLVLTPGTASGFVSINGAYTLPRADSTATYVLTTDGAGAVTFQRNALRVTADSGSPSSIGILNDTLSIQGANGIATSVTSGTVTVSVSTASYATKGIASFTSTDFVVTDGAVALATTGVTTGTFGSTTSIPTITVNSKGQITSVTTSSIATSLNVAGSTGSTVIDLASSTLTFVGATSPITVAVTTNTVSIAVADATTSTKGLVTFNGSDFNVVNGQVTLKTGGGSNARITLGTTNVDLGSTATTVSGLTLTGGNFDGNSIAFPVGFGTTIKSGYEASGVQIQSSTNNTAFKTWQFKPDGVTQLPGFALPALDGSTGTVLTTDGAGNVTWQAASSNLAFTGDTGSSSVNLVSGSLGFRAGANGGISILASGTNVYFDLSVATTSTKGIASFDSSNFTVASGVVSSKTITLGTSTLALGSTTLSLEGLDQLTVDNLTLNNNDITANNVNGSVNLKPSGIGTVDVNSKRITSVATPDQPTDAANKAYVDAAVAGVHVHLTAQAATTASLATITGDTVTYNTLTIVLSTALTAVDGYSLLNGDRLLVKNETDTTRNGVYVWATGGTTLTRSSDFDTPAEVGGGDFFFIVNGYRNGDTGWVQTEKTTTIGTDPILFTQFSGAGTYLAGDGLSADGTVFNVNVAAQGGVEIVSDAIQLKHTVAGSGLIYTNGVIDIGGTNNRIVVNADAIDISNSYTGQTSITTLGTLTNAVWNATAIGPAYGGTGRTTFNYGDILVGTTGSLTVLAMGTAGQVLQVSADGGSIGYADLDGGTY